MGTEVELLAVAAPRGALTAARGRLADLEARWSRFRPDSEISTLNRAAGRPVAVSPGTLTLPPGIRLDPGGIAKGYTADLLCADLRAAGAAGVCVNVGGDLRASGTAPGGGPWTIAVPNPHGGQAATLELSDGAAATSSPLRRAWHAGGRRAHHLIDPHSGQPADTSILQATMVTAEAWRAEVAAKAAFLAGLPDALPLATRLGAEALVVDQDGRLHLTAGLQQTATAPLAGTE
jgi:thiamine biosynthesis lipoprotein